MLEQDLGQAYPPGTRQINRQFRHNNCPIQQTGTCWFYLDTNLDAPPNYNNCSFRNKWYFFTYEDETEEEFIWNKTENCWDLSPWYRDPKPVIPNNSEQEEETSKSDSNLSHNQTLINTRNIQTITNILGQASGTIPSMPIQFRRGKVKLSDNYTGDRTESQKFIL